MPNLIPYSAVEQHALIGDRRTAALVASDGTLDWLCLPDYDGTVVFGALLDARRGGFWRVGPSGLWRGEQVYDDSSPVVRTRWTTDAYAVELTDAMAMPADVRASGRDGARIVLRRLECLRGSAPCVSTFRPGVDFSVPEAGPESTLGRAGTYQLWSDREDFRSGCRSAVVHAQEIVWMVFEVGSRSEWSAPEAERLLDDVHRFWRDVMRRLDFGSLREPLQRSAITIRLLEYVPAGSVVAAPTTSVPERIGGDWNVDYRLTWLRDASLAMGTLASFGDRESAGRYLGWLSGRSSKTAAPLQVLYDIHGGNQPTEIERKDVEGYRGSKPIRFGNHAFRQHQLDSFGYLADCALTYFEAGGRWAPDFWRLLCRAADYVARHWSDAGNGIWELSSRQRYVSGRVMCWVTLDRVLRIANRMAVVPDGATAWTREREAIRHEVETLGWSDRLCAFKQSLEHDVLDASALLMVIVGFLPAQDPRVQSTIDAVAERLTIDGCVYRFDPEQVIDRDGSMGQYESAFLPCTFWLATACALTGRTRDARDILDRVRAVAGPLGLFAEAIDPRSRAFAGNTPLLFSHVEYIRAVRALNRA